MKLVDNHIFLIGIAIAAVSILGLTTSCDGMKGTRVNRIDLTYIEKTIFFNEQLNSIQCTTSTMVLEGIDFLVK